MMTKLPHGWTPDYTIRYLLEKTDELVKQVAQLEEEIARLDREKQGRRGPKVRTIAQGNARPGATL